jgi:hypothetical protein
MRNLKQATAKGVPTRARLQTKASSKSQSVEPARACLNIHSSELNSRATTSCPNNAIFSVFADSVNTGGT